MATTINAGRVRFVSRGTYNNSTQYYLFDLVDYNGSSYIAKENTVGNLPTNTQYWQLIAEKGNTGNTGQTGPVGATGNGIASITKTGTSGLVDTYTITYTNGNTTTFTITNGEDGEVTETELDVLRQKVANQQKVIDQLPQVTGQGTSITLENTIEAQFTKFDIEGNSEQEATPSPDYPSEVKSCGDNINLFDKDNMTIGKIWSGTTLLDSDVGNASPKIPVKAGKTYIRNAGYSSNYIIKEDNSVVDIQGRTNAITMPENSKYWIFNIPKDIDINTIKAEEGLISTPYSPYGQGCINEVICNKNLFDKNTTTDGKYIGNNGSIQTQSNIMHSDYIQIKTNINYYITGRYEWASVALYDKNKTFLERISTTQPNGVLNITNSNCKYIIINALLKDKDTLQLEEGSTATTYIEHQSQSYTIPTQQPMRAIGNVRDKFILKENGKWYERHNIKEVILTGNENWSQRNQGDGTNTITFNVNLLNVGAYGSNNVLCDKFVYEQNSSSGNEGIGFESTLVTQYIQINRNRLSSLNLAGFKEWISNNNIKVYYVLEIPEDIECTEEQIQQLENRPSTYKDFTIIQSQDETEAYLEVSGIYDLNNLINN